MQILESPSPLMSRPQSTMCRPVAIFPWRRLAEGSGVSPCAHCGDIGNSSMRIR